MQFQIKYRGVHEKGLRSLHSLFIHYRSIPLYTINRENVFQETICINSINTLLYSEGSPQPPEQPDKEGGPQGLKAQICGEKKKTCIF